MTDRGSGNGSGDPATPGAGDVRGEDLASHDLAQPEEFTIADDETEAEELTDVVTGEVLEGDIEIDDPDQLIEAEDEARGAESTELETLADRVRSSRPVRKSADAGKDVAKKGVATKSRRSASGPTERRTTPAQFVSQSADELKKVVWPTPEQVRQYFVVVLVFVLFIMAYVVALDTGFGALLLRLFG